jgi:biopolymer transport protein ExbB/TolQ
VLTGNVDRAVKLCGAAPNAPLAKVIRAGLTRANRGEIEVAKSIEEAILENNPHISARIQWLWSLANVATLFGLIGTIVGLIGTFKSLGNVPADQKQALLSKGISEAMNNTAFGLGIAVTCIIFHLFLTAYAKRMIETVELNAMKLENLLGRRNAGETSAMDFEKAS